MTSSRTADRRALPASSRNGVSLNSTVRGTLYDAMRSDRNAMTSVLVEPVGLHDGVRHLAQVVVGYANHQAGQHIRVGRQRRFDLGGVDVASSDGEHVHSPVVEIEEAVGVEIAEVAERVPAVATLRGGTDIAVCRRASRRRTHVDLTDHARRALVAVVVEHLHLARDHDADRAAVRQPLRRR